MRRGEVWRVSLPFATGHAQGGDRPAVIIQADSFTASLPTVMVVPFTGTLAASRFPGTLVVQPDGQKASRSRLSPWSSRRVRLTRVIASNSSGHLTARPLTASWRSSIR
jgi:mRNA-degrading endonuclease toxin of MazEF toxin-antitoxin module